jgi:glycosyltransferase involved in cell wall biosynthesis
VRIAHLADAYLTHTVGGADHLARAGIDPQRVFVVHNTLDTERQVGFHAQLERDDPAVLRAKLGLETDSVVLLFVGRVYKDKRVGELVEAARVIREGGLARRRVEVVIVGDGPDLPNAKALAGDGPVHFRGSIRDQFEVARYMRIASAVVIPGKVGLAANHSFAQGLPIITRAHQLHSPEIEYVRHGENGLIISGSMENFARALAEFVDSDSLQQRLAAEALATRDTLSVESMAANFDEGVCAALAKSADEQGTS